MRVIRIDDDVYQALQKLARPFVDTPNSVLRRLLGLNGTAWATAPGRAAQGVKGPLSGASSGGLVGMDSLTPSPHDAAPGQLRLPDGQQLAVHDWKSLFAEVVRHLIRAGKLGPSACPVHLPRYTKRYVVHTEPQHPSGRGFFQPVDVGGGLWLETHNGASDILDRIRFILTVLGEDPSKYLVQR